MAKAQVIQPGYYVAVYLVPGVAPRVCYIGLVQAVDEHGVRINPVHWDEDLDVIAANTEDFFTSWTNVASMLVCTDKQPSRRFVRDKAPEWRAAVESMQASKTATKAAKNPRETKQAS